MFHVLATLILGEGAFRPTNLIRSGTPQKRVIKVTVLISHSNQLHAKLYWNYLHYINPKGPYTCKKRADDLLKLGRHQLKMAVAILTGHAPAREHLRIMDLFSGDPSCRFCKMENETVQHITCCCEALACQRYNNSGKLFAKPKDISTASIKDLCLFIRDTGILNLCWMTV